MSRSRSEDHNDLYIDSLITEELADHIPNDDGLSLEEVFWQQETMLQSFQHRQGNNMAAHDGIINDPGNHVVGEGEVTRIGDFLAHFAIDEAMAISLQELGDEFDNPYNPAPNSIASGSSIPTPSRAQASSSNSGQDPVDPDNMEYEELVELTESVGVENRGISASRIAELPTSKYKSGNFFSKYKKKKEKCVVCQTNYHSGEQLITLPCSHRYHSKCISDWLMLKKNCPVCQKEVD